MKRSAGALILACGCLLSEAAEISLLYPLGGEKLPSNGKHVVTWTNSVDMPGNLYVDWYETSGTLAISNVSLLLD